MAETGIKEILKEKIDGLDDEILLQNILSFIEIESDVNSHITFSSGQLSQLEKAKKSARNSGRSNQEVFEKTQKWLNQ